MKKILTVSLFAMMAVSAANADIASTKYVDDIAKTKQASLGFTPENVANKIDDIPEALNDITDGQYPSAKAVFQYVSGQIGSVSVTNNTLKGEVDTLKSTTAALDAEKQDNLSADQLSAVNSGITSAGVTQITTNKNAIATLNGNDQTEGSVAYQVKELADGAVATNTASINTINNGAVMKSGITSAGVTQITTNKNAIDTINNGAVMKSGVTADVVAKANSAMQEANLKALQSWTSAGCNDPEATCSLVSKKGSIAWEKVTY